MATVNRLQLELAAFEHELKETIKDDSVVKQAIRAGYSAAEIAATQRILELSVKGVIPEGKGGTVMEQVKSAINESRDRVTRA